MKKGNQKRKKSFFLGAFSHLWEEADNHWAGKHKPKPSERKKGGQSKVTKIDRRDKDRSRRQKKTFAS